MEKKGLITVIVLAWVVACHGTAQNETEALITAILRYGLTNKRTVEHQRAFEVAFERAKTHLNNTGATEATNDISVTPVMAAAYSLSYYAILKLILAGADPEIQGSNRYDAYDWVDHRTWIQDWFPRFKEELYAALSFNPTTPEEREFGKTLLEVYRELEPRLVEKWRGFYKESQRAGVVQFMRHHCGAHEKLMKKAGALLLRTTQPDPDYVGLTKSARRLLRDIQAVPAQPRHHHHD